MIRAHKRDAFIEFIKSLLLTPFVLNTRPGLVEPGRLTSKEDQPNNTMNRYLEIFGCIEDLINDHMLHTRNDLPELSRLSTLVPNIGAFFTSLPLKATFLALEKSHVRSIAGRRLVPPSFNDVRHILNFAQVNAIANTLKFITFDGDMTLYADGADFAKDSALVGLILRLLKAGVWVAIVTAAGYPGDADRYEQRLLGLLAGFKASDLSHDALSHFYVLGGECNYLFQYEPAAHRLKYIPEDSYQPEKIRRWSQATDRINKLLDVAEMDVRHSVSDMNLTDRVSILRKQRAIGVYPKEGFKLTREQLDEIALSAQQRIHHHQHSLLRKSQKESGLLDESSPALYHPASIEIPIPFCSFNGGGDVWVDIGNKLIGVLMLQEMFGFSGNQTLHVGDQFSATGNDIATRRACCTVWITDPNETAQILTELTRLIQQ